MDNSHDEYIGKRLLIGITFVDADDVVLEQFQTHGIITSINDRDGVTIEQANGAGIFYLPPDVENLHEAAAGEYKLRATGEIVVDPDYLTTWTVETAKSEEIPNYTASGFGPFSRNN
jgi:hypothetical protein